MIAMAPPPQIIPASPIKRKKNSGRRAGPRRSLGKALRAINKQSEKRVEDDAFSIQISECDSINAASEISGIGDSDCYSVRSSSSLLFDDDDDEQQDEQLAQHKQTSTATTTTTCAGRMKSLYDDSSSTSLYSLTSPRKRSSRTKLVHRECAKSLLPDTESLKLEDMFSNPSPRHIRKEISASLSSSLDEDMLLTDVKLKNLYDDDDEDEVEEKPQEEDHSCHDYSTAHTEEDISTSEEVTICLIDEFFDGESVGQLSCSSVGSLYDDDEDED